MNRKLFLFLVIFFLVLFFALLFIKRDFTKGIFGFFLRPLWKAEAYLSSEIREFFKEYLILVDIKRENQKLREALLKLQQELAYYQERESLYQSLEKLYNIQFFNEYPKRVARIIYKNINPYEDQVIIDKGSKDGLMPQMPVLAWIGGSGIGLVGQIVEVHKNWSKVILLTDPSFSVDAKIISTQERAILRGKAEPLALLEYIPLYSQVKEKDILVTSGQDLLFPPGILIGEIISVEKDPQGLFKKANVKPLVDIYNLSWVVILLKVPEITF